ncbi:transposase family protein [Cereibacter azotoformans]|uniref:Integrase catalytic domain-containing protein n=1 Tax=Cereibacter sphaeroides (strain ATCC 17025 / ATH 2.4.3) TaxID=349102 RepID=A4WSF8_CERS5|nr:hypothetical protein [Cereibacter azotoformans]ULB09625.1 transposase family protein [Cereibacter azotoformans]
MTSAPPRYNFPEGTAITLLSQELVLNGISKDGYEFTNAGSGAMRVVPFLEFVQYIKLPGAKIDVQLPLTGNRLKARLGGYATSAALPDEQQAWGRFRFCVCQAMKLLREHLRAQFADPDYELSIRKMDQREHRIFVRDIAQRLFGQPIYLEKPERKKRGQEPMTPAPNPAERKSRPWTLDEGRTLMKHFRVFENLMPGEDPLDALVPLYHLRGYDWPRICTRLKELMTQAIEEVALDLKDPSLASAMKHLVTLIRQENAIRRRNELHDLIIPAASTLKAQRDELLTPTEFLIATKGERHARNKRGRGSTDIRALTVGEFVEIDECKASLVTSAKANRIWERLSVEDRAALEKIDEEIRLRFIILVMIDVASRMPLAWIISDQPKAEATLALYRMATRDKIREKTIYGCEGDPVPAVGLGNVRMDNGTGLRNSTCVEAVVGIGGTNTTVRVAASADKPYIERMLGTTESVLFKLIHGYTGRRPGDLPGYDATASGILDIDELYGILTRYMIDEYPSTRHMGVGMGGRRPSEVYKLLNETRRCFGRLDENTRRIHLGWEDRVTPTDEGVRAFSGLWYSSPEFQEKIDGYRGKVSVFVDPDDVTQATVLVPGEKEPFTVVIQITAFADLTLPQVLELMAEWRKEDPETAEIHDDRLARIRRDRHDSLKALGVERKLPRSHSTIEECKAKAKALFAGARIIRGEVMPGTTPVGSLTQLGSGPAIFQLGSGDRVIEGTAIEIGASDADKPGPVDRQATTPPPTAATPDEATSSRKTAPSARSKKNVTTSQSTVQFLGRPKDLGKPR